MLLVLAPILAAGASLLKPPVDSTLPTIDNTSPHVGDTLTASPGTWTHNPISYAYQWKRAGVNIGGATSNTYVAAGGDIGSALSVAVRATNAGGTSHAATSAATTAVPLPAPVNTVLPAISNANPVYGTAVSTTNGTWLYTPTSYAYQWANQDGAIMGATSSSYTPVAGDIGETLTVTVIATNTTGDSSPATSSATSAVVPLPPVNTVAPALSSDGSVPLPQNGDHLSVDTGTWDSDPSDAPVSYSYQWYNSNGIRPGTNSNNYVISGADAGDHIWCVVTATNAGGFTTAESDHSGTA